MFCCVGGIGGVGDGDGGHGVNGIVIVNAGVGSGGGGSDLAAKPSKSSVTPSELSRSSRLSTLVVTESAVEVPAALPRTSHRREDGRWCGANASACVLPRTPHSAPRSTRMVAQQRWRLSFKPKVRQERIVLFFFPQKYQLNKN